MARPKGTSSVMRSCEEKERLIREYYSSNLSKASFAGERGIAKTVFERWVKAYEKEGIEGLKSKTGKHSGNIFAVLNGNKKLTEVERLRLENMRKDIEIARLKKGYFVKGVGSKKEYVSIKNKITK